MPATLSLVQALLWLAVLAFLAVGIAGGIAVWRWTTTQARKQALAETEATAERAAKQKAEDARASLANCPAALLALVERESEPWAREDAARIVAESYLNAGGDWTKAAHVVANRYGVTP